MSQGGSLLSCWLIGSALTLHAAHLSGPCHRTCRCLAVDSGLQIPQQHQVA